MSLADMIRDDDWNDMQFELSEARKDYEAARTFCEEAGCDEHPAKGCDLCKAHQEAFDAENGFAGLEAL